MRERIRIAQIIEEHWESFQKEVLPKYQPKREDSIRVEVEKMLACHEGRLGYAEYICEHCQERRRICFSCKGKFCPKCGKVYTDKWVLRMKEHLLEVPHRHLVFTLSDTMRPLIWEHHERLLRLMMDVAAQTVEEVVAERHRGLEVGIVLTVHTVGRDLKYNPHVHLLLTEGGLGEDGQWHSISYLPYPLLRRKWQYLLLTGLREELGKSPELSSQIDEWFRKHPDGFYVYAEKQLKQVRFVARYLGRYLCRSALGEYKIIKYDGEQVTFWYEDHRSGMRVVETLGAHEFIKRLVNHIVKSGFKKVRHYGLYARRRKNKVRLILCRSKGFIQQNLKFVEVRVKPKSFRMRIIESFGEDPLLCPRCGREMALYRIWHPKYGELYNYWEELQEVESGRSPPEKEEKTTKKTSGNDSYEPIGAGSQLCMSFV